MNRLIALIVFVCIMVIVYEFLSRTKIAYVESQKIIENFSETIRIRKQFEGEKSVWNSELKVLNDSLTAAMDRMKKEYDNAAPKRKKELEAAVEKRNIDFAKYKRAVEQKSVAREQELMNPVLGKINSFMEIWGKQHGYDLILGTANGGNIVQANKKLDVTAEVLKDLNASYK